MDIFAKLALEEKIASSYMFANNREKNVEEFCKSYLKNLENAVKTNPTEYLYSIEECPKVVEKMKAAFIRGSYNHDGQAIKATCKELGIKPTRTAMEAYFNKVVEQGIKAVMVRHVKGAKTLPIGTKVRNIQDGLQGKVDKVIIDGNRVKYEILKKLGGKEVWDEAKIQEIGN